MPQVTRTFQPTFVIAAALALVVGCSDGRRLGRPGDFCSADSDCELGLCYESHCLDPDGDEDGDGLRNGEERNLTGTDPLKPDTDGDGISDGAEVGNPAAPSDADGDGRNDAVESAVADPDHDCLPDQFDPRESAADQATVGQLAAACVRPGVCKAGDWAIKASCDSGTLHCDYSAVPHWESKEASCDRKDNDCNGVTDDAPGCCTPSCAGRECGDDGCGGSCGVCNPGMTCGADGRCKAGVPFSDGSDNPCMAVCAKADNCKASAPPWRTFHGVEECLIACEEALDAGEVDRATVDFCLGLSCSEFYSNDYDVCFDLTK